MTEIRCPKCGAIMVLRHIKDGPKAGEKFYGCSNYPQCKATLPYEPSQTSPNKEEKEEKILDDIELPHKFTARAKYKDYQVKFIEGIAVPEELLKWIKIQDSNEKILRAFSQWRIDFPINSEITLNNEQRCILSVAEKILTRGRITLLSPDLEVKLKEFFKALSIEDYSFYLESLAVNKPFIEAPKNLWFDSQEEKIFYEELLTNIFGNSYIYFVIPQIDLYSLIPTEIEANYLEQRVDFGIFYPNLNVKFIIEIDGEQHKSHIQADKDRDELLTQYGYNVIRIPASEIRNKSGQKLDLLQKNLSNFLKTKPEKQIVYDSVFKFLYAVKLSYQIQLVLLEALKSGFLNLDNFSSCNIITDLDNFSFFEESEVQFLLDITLSDFSQFLNNLCNLYGYKINIYPPKFFLSSDIISTFDSNTIYLNFTNKPNTNFPIFYIQDIYFPFSIERSSNISSIEVSPISVSSESDLKYFLRYIFRKENFWEGQYDGIKRVLELKDTLILLPTGGGKSLIYQLASLLLPGITIVIDPIISLMEDQIDNLSMLGIDRTIAITSKIENPKIRERILELFSSGEYLFVFVAPERFQTVEFREALRTLSTHTPISLIVIDEVHCVSEWGHDFRTSYLNIGRITRSYCKSKGYVPPLIGLTGTASKAVLKDIQRELQITDHQAIITPKSFDRQELKFHIHPCKSKEKFNLLEGILTQALPGLFHLSPSVFFQLRDQKTCSGLIFCPHVGGEFGVKEVAGQIIKKLKVKVGIYSGKEPKNWNPIKYRSFKERMTKEFKYNKLPLLVCTKAFGMGIDKPNIRYTIHYGLPPSIEAFYQEAGRAGRDRKPSHCFIIFSNDDPKRTKQLLNPNTRVEDISHTLKNIAWEENDDITRVLYFHVNSFRGIEEEKKYILEILKQLGDITKRQIKTFTIPESIKDMLKSSKEKDDNIREARQVIEKALHRLLLIGVISDYVIDYSKDEFTVEISGADKEEILESFEQYIASYLYSRSLAEVEKAKKYLDLPHFEFIKKIISLLLEFIYDVIERGRRRALQEMLLACSECSEAKSEQAFRQRILHYLSATEYSEKIEKIIKDKFAGFDYCKDILNEVISSKEADELRGQVSRFLESYPDHPGLLMLRALTEVMINDRNAEIVKQNFIASYKMSINKYSIDKESVINFIIWSLEHIYRFDENLGRELIYQFAMSLDRLSLRNIIQKFTIDLATVSAWILLKKINDKCVTLLSNKKSLVKRRRIVWKKK